jgi:hypothetical protein
MANEFKIRKGLIVTGASGGTVVDIQGSQGQLFSVTDDLSGSIFAVSDISGVPIFDVNSSGLSTFDGPATFASSVTLSSTLPLLYLNNTTASTGKNWRLSSATNGKFFITQEGVIDAVTLDHTSGNATFAGSVRVNSWLKGVSDTNTLYSSTSLGTYLQAPANSGTGGSIYLRNNSGTVFQEFSQVSGGTSSFNDGKVTSLATAASDGSTTLTTKSYVDGLVTGVPVYKGTWAAGTTGVTSAAISGTTITLTAAPTETIAVGDVVTADGIIAATTVTAVASQTSVTVSATVAIAITTTVTFSPEGGFPDLTLVAAKVLGNYYIVSTAGSAAPNGSGVEPDSWAVGDWAIFSDVTPGVGTDLWQRIDNSSVISGAGTGGTIPLWEGATNAVSETLTDSPITVSGNDSSFAGNITVGDGHFIGDDSFDNLLLQSSSGENLILSAANDLIFYTGGTAPGALGTQRLRIFNSDGSAAFAGNVSIVTGGYPLIDLGVSGTNYFRIIHDNPNDRLQIGKNGAASLIIDGSGNSTFAGLVSGITPTAAANFTTKAYVDSFDPPTGTTQFFNQSSSYNNSTPGIAGYGNISIDSTSSYYDTGINVFVAIRGLVWTGKHYIATDSGALARFYDNNFAQLPNQETNSMTLPAASNGASNNHGSGWDGRYLWTMNLTPTTIVAYDLDNGTTTATIVSETDVSSYTSSTYGIEYAEGHLYTCQGGKVSMFKVEGKTVTHVLTTGVILATITAQAITYDGSYLWFTSNGAFAYKVSLDCALVATIQTGLPPNNIGWAWNGQNIAAIDYSTGDVNIINTAATRFDTEKFLVMGGDVGIGTDSPSTKLHLGGATNTALTISKTGDLSTGLQIGRDSGTLASYIIQRENADLFIRTNNIERMRIDSSGNSTFAGDVTISKAITPLFKLLDTTNNISLLLGADDANTFIRSSSSANLYLQPGGSTALTLLSGGNVGIGETSPSSKLDVVGTNTSSNPLVELTASGTGLYQRGVRLLNGGMSAPSSIMYALGYADNARNMGQTYFHYAGSGSTSNRLSMGLHSVDDVFNILGTGNVGIGTTSPGTKLEISDATGPTIRLRRADNTVVVGDLIGGIENYNQDVDGAHISSFIRGYATETYGRKGYLSFGTAGVNSTDATEKMRIQATGDVVFGKQTSSTNTAGTVITPTGQTNISRTIGSGTTYFFRFYNAGTNSQIGSIFGSTTNISYGTSSDYRLKEDLQDFESLDIVSKIPVYDFKWKVDESRSYGVMAHELQEVLPDAVSGDKDAEEMQGVDYSKIVPILIKSIQELKADNDSLKARIETLENK